MKRIYGMAFVFTLAAYSSAGQDAVAQKQAADDKAKAELGDILQKVKLMGLEGGVMANIPNAPYSAEQITENTQTLGDGTRIHKESAVKVYRDGEGRVRRETPDMIAIFDPVSGAGYTLNPNTLTGSRMKVSVSVNRGPNSVSYSATASSGDLKWVQVLNENSSATVSGNGVGAGSGAGGGAAAFWFGSSPPDMTLPKVAMFGVKGPGKLENLGTQSMEGVNAQGERRIHTIEAGEIGNDRPIDTIDEHWYSPDLQLNVMTRHSDPRTGEQVTRLVNIRRGEPDGSLFQVPAGYTIGEGGKVPVQFKVRQ